MAYYVLVYRAACSRHARCDAMINFASIMTLPAESADAGPEEPSLLALVHAGSAGARSVSPAAP